MNFISENTSILVAFFIEVWWEIIIGLDNGLAPNRWQAII